MVSVDGRGCGRLAALRSWLSEPANLHQAAWEGEGLGRMWSQES